MSERRSKIEIIADILKVLQERRRVKPTHLLYKANLSHGRMMQYLKELEEKGLIEKEEGKNTMFCLTDKGAQFLANYRNIKELIEAFGL